MKNIKIINIIYFIISNRIRTSAQPIFRLSLSTLQKRLVSSNFFVSKKNNFDFSITRNYLEAKSSLAISIHTPSTCTHIVHQIHMKLSLVNCSVFGFNVQREHKIYQKKEKERNLFRNDLN